MDSTDDMQKFDSLFARWRLKNPRGSFSQFVSERVEASLKKSKAHTTLGGALTTSADWATDGLANCEQIFSKCPVGPEARICDYGCGSLRVGLHIMRRQLPGRYYGLDVTNAFITRGMELVGTGLLEEKRPILGTIHERLPDVVASGIDVAFSFNVASHVHPDDFPTFAQNLKNICHKDGAILLLHGLVHPTPVRFQRSGWAWPVSSYIKWFDPLRLIESDPRMPVKRGDVELETFVFKFVR